MRTWEADRSSGGAAATGLPQALEVGADAGERLTPDQAREAEGLGIRLQSELAGALRAMPEASRGASAMSRLLSIDRSLCQRVINAVQHQGASAEVLLKVPGVQGLRTFVRGMRKARLDKGVVSGVESATERFGELLDELHLSQSGLSRRLRAPARPVSIEYGEDPRTRAFEATVEMLGHSTDVNIVVAAYRPDPNNPRVLQGGYVRGFVGYRARRGSMPLVVVWGVDLQATGERVLELLDGTRGLGEASSALMKRYCSEPVPRVVARDTGRARVVVVDPEHVEVEKPIDVVMASRSGNAMKHPSFDDPPTIEMWAQQKVPGRRVLIDVWLHRSLARGALPSLGLYITQPQIIHMHGRDWTARLPSEAKLQVIEPQAAAVRTPAYPRHAEMTRDFFGALGWDMSEMIGYRCEDSRPPMGSAYCVAFDFERDGGEGGG